MRLRTTTSASVLIFAAATSALADALDSARAALANGEFAKAAEIAGKVAESSKDRLKALCVIGDVELAQERWDAAETAFRTALAKQADFVPAMTGVGRALTGKGAYDEADQILGRAVKVDNRDAAAWRAQCANFIARGGEEHLVGAKVNLEATLKLDAKDPLTNRMYVELLLGMKKLDDADKATETYFKSDKDSATGWFLRGLVLDARKAADKAVDAWQKAVKKDDRLADAHRALATALAASDPTHKDAAKLKTALASAQRYADLGGRDKATLALLDALKAAAASASAGK
jgi:tetratricopeptide (TPR) repeat protein